jgi:DNA-binding MarR family transcriptional regulator
VTTHSPGPAATSGGRDDEVDELVDFWRHENPDLDVVTKGIAVRLRRTTHLLERFLRHELGEHGVEMWAVEMLLALRRAPGYSSSAGRLMRESQVTSGAITNRLGRLESHGWVRRDVDPTDRRQVLVTLTDDGLVQADRILTAKTLTEQRFFGGVDRTLVERMNDDLRTLMASLDPAGPEAPSEGPTPDAPG